MEILIRRVRDPFGWMGNMSPHPIRWEGQEFRTSEALFQALRFLKGSEAWEAIRAEKSPMGAKMRAKTLLGEAIISPRSPEDVNNMRLVLRAKLTQHGNLVPRLLETGTARLIEDCTARPTDSGLFWGMARTADGWTGENMLGRLWEELRSELQESP